MEDSVTLVFDSMGRVCTGALPNNRSVADLRNTNNNIISLLLKDLMVKKVCSKTNEESVKRSIAWRQTVWFKQCITMKLSL